MEEKLEVEEPWLMESTEHVGDSVGTCGKAAQATKGTWHGHRHVRLEEECQARDSRKHDSTDLETYLRRPWPPFRGQLMGFHDRQNLGGNEDRKGIQ